MNEQKLIKNIQKIAPKHCDNCGNRYMPDNFKVLKLINNNALIHLNCPTCGNTYILNAYTTQAGVTGQRVPIIVDLNSAKEVEKFAKQKAISKDDAIDFYNLLSSKDIISKLSSNAHIRQKRVARDKFKLT